MKLRHQRIALTTTKRRGLHTRFRKSSSQSYLQRLVVVRDDADNLLPNIAVVFTIEAGDASFVDTSGAQAVVNPNNLANPSKPAQRITLYTDKNGLVALRPQVGNTEGLIRINVYAEQTSKTDSTPGMQNAGSGSNTPPAGSPGSPGSSAGSPVGNANFLIQAKAA